MQNSAPASGVEQTLTRYQLWAEPSLDFRPRLPDRRHRRPPEPSFRPHSTVHRPDTARARMTKRHAGRPRHRGRTILKGNLKLLERITEPFRRYLKG